MRILLVILILMCSGCSQRGVEEFAFRESLKYGLLKTCEEDETCKALVKEQIKGCIESSDWKSFLDNQDDETIKNKFLTEFYGCLVDGDGNPLFILK